MDRIFINRAINLAKKGRPAPNPRVGAVLVKGDKVVGVGYHRRSGLPHAEVVAIRDGGSKTKNATLYVNLEPCCHYGQTPPCTEQIIKSGITKVVIGIGDPNPLVRGRGIEVLKKAGVETVLGVEQEKCREVNRGYLKRMNKKIPFITIKIASSLDGKIATEDGESQWITSKESRTYTHFLRSKTDAIVVGIGTIIKDDPQLTVRHVVGESPARIIIDPELKIPPEAKVLSGETPTYVLSRVQKDLPNAKIIELKDFEPLSILKKIGELGFNEIIIEGGGKIFSSVIHSRLFDEVVIVYGAKFIGAGRSFAQFKIDRLADSLDLDIIEVRKTGRDVMIRGKNVYRNNH